MSKLLLNQTCLGQFFCISAFIFFFIVIQNRLKVIMLALYGIAKGLFYGMNMFVLNQRVIKMIYEIALKKYT